MISFLPAGVETHYPANFNFSPVPVIKGRFRLEGKISQPTKVLLLLTLNGSNIYISDGFFIESGKQTIICKSDTTSWNREIPDIYNRTMLEYLNQYRTREYLSLDTLSDFYLSKKLETEYLNQYAQKHPDSYVALWEISSRLMAGYNKQLDSIFQSMSENIKSSHTGRLISEDLRHEALTDTGKIFPVIQVINQQGEMKSIAYDKLNAKYIFIDFWYSHCGPCLSQFPDYVKINSKYQNKGFAMIGISNDSSSGNIEAWKKIIHSKSLNWLQYRTNKETIHDLDINWFPWNFLLDKSGKIIAKNLEPNQLSAILEAGLN